MSEFLLGLGIGILTATAWLNYKNISGDDQ